MIERFGNTTQAPETIMIKLSDKKEPSTNQVVNAETPTFNSPPRAGENNDTEEGPTTPKDDELIKKKSYDYNTYLNGAFTDYRQT